jgi:hypothetical protein
MLTGSEGGGSFTFILILILVLFFLFAGRRGGGGNDGGDAMTRRGHRHINRPLPLYSSRLLEVAGAAVVSAAAVAVVLVVSAAVVLAAAVQGEAGKGLLVLIFLHIKRLSQHWDSLFFMEKTGSKYP